MRRPRACSLARVQLWLLAAKHSSKPCHKAMIRSNCRAGCKAEGMAVGETGHSLPGHRPEQSCSIKPYLVGIDLGARAADLPVLWRPAVQVYHAAPLTRVERHACSMVGLNDSFLLKRCWRCERPPAHTADCDPIPMPQHMLKRVSGR